MTDPSTILAVADKIEKSGWCQHNLREGHTGKMCLMGGFNLVHHSSHHWPPTAEGFADCREFAQALGFADIHQAIAWNNAPGQTQSNVVRELRRKAAAPLAPKVVVPEFEGEIKVTRTKRVIAKVKSLVRS